MKKNINCIIPFLIVLFSFNIVNKKPDACFISTVESPKKDQADNWNVIKAEDGALILADGRKVKTTLLNLKYIGQLQTKGKAPYFILSGRNCATCDENVSIYIWSPSDGPMLKNGKQPHYSYPGKEMDYATSEIIYESRMFYGNCSVYANSVIWVQKNRDDKKNWESSIFIVRIVNNKLKEIKLTNPNQVNEVLMQLNSCKELPGIDTIAEP